ncbi:hypothetical protein NQ317_001570 [Molorchus minor]|uniref:Uncharacterized protein n=1 Tax=Molorchus minor TaxID=1323400 RepID=A0ABQ9JAF4_9CUCU|nr:hypothetical protein NQ317_001570 [Molorchus minor]
MAVLNCTESLVPQGPKAPSVDDTSRLLQAQHPAENPIQTVHEKPTVLHPEDQQEPMPILQTKKCIAVGMSRDGRPGPEVNDPHAQIVTATRSKRESSASSR